jgi:ferric-dicitrate binding protein FerR (iron transport regulator)
MNFSKEVIQAIINKFNRLSSKEDDSLVNDWLNSAIENKNSIRKILKILVLSKDASLSGKIDKKKAWSIIDKKTQSRNIRSSKTILLTQTSKKPNGFSILLVPQIWHRIAAAAIIIFMCGTSYYFINKSFNNQSTTKNISLKNDVLPGGKKAILKLGDGSQIVLDNASNGLLAQQAGTQILKLSNGKVTYKSNVLSSKEVLYNTISTPRGGSYELTLPDGTMVWLNAESSIKFPTTFTDNERKVTITGEAYFEVTSKPLPYQKGKKMPFIVNVAGKSQVTVLGTHFNINSYDDEISVKTTLLEGSVKVTPISNHKLLTNNSVLITPGQQAQLSKTGKVTVSDDINTEEIVGWKDGNFIFNSSDIHTVMHQISKWYDVDIQYVNVPETKFFGIISRNIKLSQVLNILETTGSVKFTIENKTIIVK